MKIKTFVITETQLVISTESELLQSYPIEDVKAWATQRGLRRFSVGTYINGKPGEYAGLMTWEEFLGSLTNDDILTFIAFKNIRRRNTANANSDNSE